MKAFRAYAKNYTSIIAENPRKAAVDFFDSNPAARKCNITEGELDGDAFIVRLSVLSAQRLQSWKDVRKSMTHILPNAA